MVICMNYSMPLTIDIDITNRCNCACVHCNKSPNTTGNELTVEQIVILVDELYNLGTAEISLSGGEPLCRDDWFDIVKNSCSYPGLSVVLNTNGILWKIRDINRIKSLGYPPKIAVSLDGYSPDTYSALRRYKNGKSAGTAFPYLIKTIQRMKTAGLNVERIAGYHLTPKPLFLGLTLPLEEWSGSSVSLASSSTSSASWGCSSRSFSIFQDKNSVKRDALKKLRNSINYSAGQMT